MPTEQMLTHKIALSDTAKGPENAISRVTVSENAIKTNRVMDLCPNVKKSKF